MLFSRLKIRTQQIYFFGLAINTEKYKIATKIKI